jgi:hypothetical protein
MNICCKRGHKQHMPPLFAKKSLKLTVKFECEVPGVYPLFRQILDLTLLHQAA